MILDTPTTEMISLNSGNAKIKVDTFNKRIKILQLTGDLKELLQKLKPLIEEHELAKIFYISLEEDIEKFKEQGFIMEAKIDNFLNGKSGYFLSKFLTTKRKMSISIPEEEEILIKAREYIDEKYYYPMDKKFTIKTAEEDDVFKMTQLYNEVFETYPTPLHDEKFIKSAINNDVLFKLILWDDKIISSASADMDSRYLNAEMTDCATLKQYRGEGLMGRLIYELEEALKKTNYKVLYSMARAISPGMNIVFSKHGYEYGGRLINHCHICGQLEDMNIWIKKL
ncbi:putative beta-lysine N-acetyltransferase [Clostridium ganghwense]|uniref:Beta-lysine N-acetyltransferase n=1 Tax=Clostridium ganghwense TaxID=312089 RepID=A0ABT4CPZ5_9CLOT|nr:putative beta-lysine N-acetyltransferase [Clostridium ganghwense]MCY6371122.1 putative beta-lysine N-acetyltransferase [Clostridium ganghwense]